MPNLSVRFPCLVTLKLVAVSLSFSAFQGLSQLSSLRQLSLDRVTSAVGEFANTTSSGQPAEVLQHLQQLTSLCIINAAWTYDFLQGATDLTNLCSLAILDDWSKYRLPDSIPYNMLCTLTLLTSLTVDDLQLDLPAMTNLQRLHICDVISGFPDNFSVLQSLTCLDVHNRYVSTQELATVGSLKSLDHLTFRGALWFQSDEDRVGEELFDLPYDGLTTFTSVRTLELLGVLHHRELLYTLAHLTQLTALSLRPEIRCAVSPWPSVQHLHHLPSLTNLQRLSMDFTYRVSMSMWRDPSAALLKFLQSRLPQAVVTISACVQVKLDHIGHYHPDNPLYHIYKRY